MVEKFAQELELYYQRMAMVVEELYLCDPLAVSAYYSAPPCLWLRLVLAVCVAKWMTYDVCRVIFEWQTRSSLRHSPRLAAPKGVLFAALHTSPFLLSDRLWIECCFCH